MRGTESTIAGVPQAVAVLDLALAGVHCELGDDPFAWLGAKAPLPPVVPAAVNGGEVAASAHVGVEIERPNDTPLGRIAAKPLLPDSLPEPAVKRVVPPTVEVPARIWREGDKADVALIVQGDVPDARCRALVQAMLVAAGLKDSASGWVGFEGKPDADALRAEIAALQASHVLVMGQAPLGILLGRNVGVEGWHVGAGAVDLGLDGAVGVTYPPELLLKQPLFKRLAWQHLLAWGHGA